MSDRDAPDVLLRFRDVSYAVSDGTGRARTLLEPLDLEVAAGTLCLLEGPSGAGKSTVLALACGALLPTSGEVWFDGKVLSRLRDGFRTDLRRTRMSVAAQLGGLIPGMSVLENVLLARIAASAPTEADVARARSALADLGAEALGDRNVDALSGGERLRVALARTLATRPEPRLWLWDEPTAHVDAALVTTLAAALTEHRRTGGSALVATHDPRLRDALTVDQCVTLVAGRRQGDPLSIR